MEPNSSDIAIIGMSCRFPGHCNDLNSFWNLLATGGDAITSTDCRWGEHVALPTNGHGGFLDDVDAFDASFFSVLPKEALKIDPQHRLLLELHWETLESACIPVEHLRGSYTGVYAGIAWNEYESLSARKQLDAATTPAEHHDLYLTTGTTHSMAPGLVSFFFDLKGPSMAIDTACSSSLVAVHQAAQALLAGDCETAFASGVCLNLSPDVSTNFTQSKMLSERCRVFDSSARGYCRSEGAAVVMLKRYSDAVRDGNRVLALLKGSATNQNGKGTAGITAPSVGSQCGVYERALAKAGLSPSDIQYIEAHGTGTGIGDPAELESIVTVYGRRGIKGETIGIGSVKTNIGHTEMAAGLAGLIKVVLALQYEYIPPHIHFKQLTPKSPPLEEHGLEVVARGRKWPAGSGQQRLAAVSSFGFSGSNAHVIIAEAPRTEKLRKSNVLPKHGLLTLAAKSKSSLDALLTRYRTFLKDNEESMQAGIWVDAAYTTNVGRTHFPHHRAAIVMDADAGFGTRGSSNGTAGTFQGSSSKSNPPTPVHLVLTGSYGQELVSLATELYKQPAAHALFRDIIDDCNRAWQRALKSIGINTGSPQRPLLADFLFDPSASEQATHKLLVTFVLEYALAAMLNRYGITPVTCTCYGLGEYVGVAVAGILSLYDTLTLVLALERAQEREEVAHIGVLFVRADGSVVQKLIASDKVLREGMSLYTGSNHGATLVFGHPTKIQLLTSLLEDDRHSPTHSHSGFKRLPDFCMPTESAREFSQLASGMKYGASKVELLFGYGRAGTEVDAKFWFESRLLAAQAKSTGVTVRFEEPLVQGQGARGHSGHHHGGGHHGRRPSRDDSTPPRVNVLFGLQAEMLEWKQSDDESGTKTGNVWLTVGKERNVYELLGLLYSMGHNVDLQVLHHGQKGARTLLELPKYAFEKKRFWYPDIPLVRAGKRMSFGTGYSGGHSTKQTGNNDKEGLTKSGSVDSPMADTDARSCVTLTEKILDQISAGAPTAWAPEVQQYEDLLRDLCLTRIVRAFTLLGIPKQLTSSGKGAAWELGVLASSVGVHEKHSALFEYLVGMLAAEGYLKLDTGHAHGQRHLSVGIGSKAWPPIEELTTSTEAMKKKLRAMDSSRDVLLELSSKCGADLHLILQRKSNALKHLFPPPGYDNVHSVDRFYSHSPDLLAANQMLEKVIGALNVDPRSGAPIRILEVGAGTGGTTGFMLSGLDGRGLPFELDFTDISRAFFHDAKERLKTGPNVHYKVFNIERDPLAQGFEPHLYDVILGSNVVHATNNIRRTLDNLKRVLRPGGYLLLVEYIYPVVPLDIVFGNLSGWWAFKGPPQDPDRAHRAIMDPPTWGRVLDAVGFEGVRSIGFPVAVIVGRLREETVVDAGANHRIVVSPPSTPNAIANTREVISKRDSHSVPEDLRARAAARSKEREESVRTKLLDALVRITGLEREEIDDDREFGELGLDSLMMVALEDALTEEFGLSDPGVALETYGSVRALVGHIVAARG